MSQADGNGGRSSKVQGSVKPGFESVRDLYTRELETLAESNSQLCVYHRGERVVDLWAAADDEPGFSADSLVNVFSSGKSLAAIAVASLVDKGLLDYRATIARDWPEFAANGKGDLTLADLMRHEAGMAAFDTAIDPAHLLPENLRQNRVGQIIEAHAIRYPENGRRREYHAITRDWIANELFRRVEPAGRTIGEYLRQEISEPMDADAFIGVTEAELARVSKVRPLSLAYQFLQSLVPAFLGRKIKHGFITLARRIGRLLFGSKGTSTIRNAPPPFTGMKRLAGLGEIFNDETVSKGETPSAAAKATARGLAKIAAMMAAHGRFAGHAFLSEAAWDAMHDERTEGDIGFGATHFSQGGVNHFVPTTAESNEMERALNTGREGFYGWMGLGGSIFQWHPEHEIGFAFVPTTLHSLDLTNERGKVFQAEVLRCVGRLGVGG